MRKHTILLLLMLTCLGAKAQDFTEVSTAAQFKAAAEKNQNIRLTADIDIRDMGMINVTYRGIIDGQGTNASGDAVYYSLTGGTGDNRVKKPIFKALDGATLRNLTIRNFRIEWDDDQVGAVACTAKNSKFNQVIISEVSIFNDDDEAGAIVGKAEGCDFRNVRGMGNDVTVDGNYAGGFVGLSYNSVYCDCSNSAMSTVYADGSWGNAYAGGFVGESNSDQFVFCVNFACVGALDDRIGGIVGYSSKSVFSNCSNSGYIMHCEEKDFLTCTRSIKQNITANFNGIIADLEKMYGKQEFSLTAGLASFLGTVGLSAVSFGVELALLSFVTCGAAFTVTMVIAITGIVVSLINLIDAEIGAHDEMGGICGSCEGTVFDCCTNYGTLMCRDSYVGGIVGLMRDISKNRMSNCLNAGEVRGYEYVGGLFGEGGNADEVSRCLNVGTVTRESSDGKTDPIGHITYANEQTMNRNYYLAGHYDESAIMRIPVEASQLADGTVAVWLNDGATGTNAPWHQNETDKYPVPDPSHEAVNPQKHDDVFAVSSVEDLDALRTAVNNGTKASYVVYITEDIDCSGTTWVPIGNYDHPFYGICYGGGHTISNLTTADDDSKNGIGFFGVVGINTEVRDLFIGSGEIRGGHSIGAIIGYAENKESTEGYIRVTGCGNAATITGYYDCGGLVGAIYSDDNMKLTLDNCYNMGAVNANERSAALCGFAKKNALVTSCWNSGSVTGIVSGKGFVRGDDAAAPEIHNCYVAEGLSSLLQSGVGTFTQADAMNGTQCYNLNGGSNDTSVDLPWKQDITSGAAYPTYKAYTQETATGVYSSRNVSGLYGTVVLPYAVQSNDTIRFYTLSSVTENGASQLNFSAVNVLPAGTPAVFRVTKPGTYKFISANETFGYTLNNIQTDGWTMTGNLNTDGSNEVFTDKEQLGSLYYISGDEIKNATNKLTISPLRAYIIGPSGSNAPTRTLSVSFDDDGFTTDIRFVRMDTGNSAESDAVYNLAGQRISSSESGISITSGKKYLNK